MQARQFLKQLKKCRDKPGLPKQLQIWLTLCLQAFINLLTQHFDSRIISILLLDHFLEIESQLHNPLFFGTGEVLGEDTLIIMVKAHAAELLFQFPIFDLIFKFLTIFLIVNFQDFFFESRGIMVEGQAGLSTCLRILFCLLKSLYLHNNNGYIHINFKFR